MKEKFEEIMNVLLLLLLLQNFIPYQKKKSQRNKKYTPKQDPPSYWALLRGEGGTCESEHLQMGVPSPGARSPQSPGGDPMLRSHHTSRTSESSIDAYNQLASGKGSGPSMREGARRPCPPSHVWRWCRPLYTNKAI